MILWPICLRQLLVKKQRNNRDFGIALCSLKKAASAAFFIALGVTFLRIVLFLEHIAADGYLSVTIGVIFSNYF
jgi:hypothetical protein